MQDSLTAFVALAIVSAAAILSALLIVALGPWLAAYAVAKPNARSSHKIPTPQGGGIAVIGATIIVSGWRLVLFAARKRKPVAAGCHLCCHASDGRRRGDGGQTSDCAGTAIGAANFRCRRGAGDIAAGNALAACSALVGRAHFTAYRHIVVRQPGELHGWPRLDDCCRGRSNYRSARGARIAWLSCQGRIQ